MTKRGYAKVHPLIKATARECAGAFFDNMDVFNDARVERTEEFRALETNQALYINRHWGEFVTVARKALAARLGLPGLSTGEQEQIYDALVSDHGLRTDEQMVAPSIMRLN